MHETYSLHDNCEEERRKIMQTSVSALDDLKQGLVSDISLTIITTSICSPALL